MGVGKPFTGGIAAIAMNAIPKYMVAANPWMMELEPIFANQWSKPFTLEEHEKALSGLSTFIHHSYVNQENRKSIDEDIFSAHYPLPPPEENSRKNVIGIQWGDHNARPLFVETWHVYSKPTTPSSSSALGGSSSSSSVVPPSTLIPFEVQDTADSVMTCVHVRLSYFNPFHTLTGIVTVSIREPVAPGGLQHPMWVLVGKRSKLGHQIYKFVHEMFVFFSADLNEFLSEQDEQNAAQQGDDSSSHAKQN